jgi:hypothetical protein
MEAIICHSPVVIRAFVFGHQRLHTGVLVQLNSDEASKYSIDDILVQVQQAVEAANQHAPSHSRIMPQMIKCLPMNQRLPATDKGNVLIILFVCVLYYTCFLSDYS